MKSLFSNQIGTHLLNIIIITGNRNNAVHNIIRLGTKGSHKVFERY